MSERYSSAAQVAADHIAGTGAPSTTQPRHASGTIPPSDCSAVTDVRGRWRPNVFSHTYARATQHEPANTALDPRNAAEPNARLSEPKMMVTPTTPAASAINLRAFTRSDPSSQPHASAS